MRILLAALTFMTIGLSACGDRNGNSNNSNVATTPNTYCLQNGSSTCTGYGQVDPRFIQPYAYGYGAGGFYSGCGGYPNQYPTMYPNGQWQPIYGSGFGMGCMNMAYAGPSPIYGSSGYASFCVIGSPCGYAGGICRPFQPGTPYGVCSSY